MGTRKNRVKYGVILMIGIGILFGGRQFILNKNQNLAAVKNTSSQIPVEVSVTQRIEIVPKLTYKATVEPLEVGLISSKISGKVTQILFDNGTYVEKGTPLVILDDQDFQNQLRAAQNQLKIGQNQLEASKPTLKKAEEALSIAKRTYDRLLERYKNLEIPMEEFEKGQDAWDLANLDYQSAKTNYETISLNAESIKININAIRDNLENTIIRSPISGVMDEKNVSLGQYITVQGSVTVMAKVKDISSVDAVVQVQQEEVKDIREGQKAIVKLVEHSGETFDGVVKKVDLSANPSARTFNCKIEVNNPDKKLRPGVFVKVEISKEQKAQVIAIPIQALCGDEGNYFVFVEEKGAAKKRNVNVGEALQDSVEIKSGLKEGERVITSNLGILQDGDSVIIVSAKGG